MSTSQAVIPAKAGIQENGLPEGWEKLAIEDIAEVNPRVDKSKISDELKVSFVPMPAVEAESGAIDVSEERPFAEVKKGFTPFIEGDVLFAKITPCMENGKMAVVPKVKNGYGFGSTEFHVLRPKDGVESKWIYYFVSSRTFRGVAQHNMSGAVGQKRVPTNYLKQHLIPVAPPEQQKRIVAKIEELYSHIDAGIEALKTAKQLLKQYRQSVLKAAVTGELTKEWREANKDKLEPASQLLERILIERRQKWEEQQLEQFSAKGKMPKNDKWKGKYEIPSIDGCQKDVIDVSWLKVNMGILKFYSIYGPRFSSDDYSEDGVVVLRTTDMDERGKVNIENAPKLDLSDSDFDRYRVEHGDLLITRTGSIGTLAIFQDDCRAIPGAYLLHYKFTQETVNPNYIYLIFKSPKIQKTLTGSTQGIGRPNLNAPTLESIEFDLPSIKEQKSIVDIVSEKFTSINRLEEEIENKLAKADKNKQSILDSAFSGALN